MKVLILYADGFEDVEAIATRDVLVRAGIDVYDAKISEDRELVTSSHKLSLSGFLSPRNINANEFDALILPGGSVGVNNLLKSELVDSLVQEFYRLNKLVCAICAAPMVLGKNSLLKNRRYTCYPGCNEGLDGIYTGEEVAVSDNIVTGRSMLFSVPFGLKIIELLISEEESKRIYRQIAGLK
ncbi:MAG: DJ-1/PfpI family protein [Bacilli bacterium]|nr:DJ-1/PfpI family protein [Bacilli bacterium]